MQREFAPALYLLASRRNGTLYVGITSNPVGRIYQHREGVIAGFSRRYGVKLLVWLEMHATMVRRSRGRSESKSGTARGSGS